MKATAYLLVLSLVLFLTGCGETKTPPPANAADKQTPTSMPRGSKAAKKSGEKPTEALGADAQAP